MENRFVLLLPAALQLMEDVNVEHVVAEHATVNGLELCSVWRSA